MYKTPSPLAKALFGTLLVLPTLALAQEAAPAPTLDAGNTAWMLTSTALVLFMTIPGLALFYGGLVRSKNVLSVLMQCFAITAMVTVLWSLYGYSLAFSTTGMEKGALNLNSFIGALDKAFFAGLTRDSLTLTIPESVFATFQMTFAIITPALIVGAFAERMKFSALLWFMGIWFTVVYTPIAHMVWSGDGGLMWDWGVLDFAGGTVVHINAAMAGLVGAYMIGKRTGLGNVAMAPHSLTFTMIGASLLWFGWFGFNAGSALEASGGAALAMVNTWVATACATLSWMFAEWMIKGKPSMLGAASGAVAGLVAITPAAGFVGVMGAMVIGLLAGVICLWGVNGLKKLLGADDSLDVFGIHGVGGILGAILTGVFVDPALGGTGVYDYVANKVGDFDMATQVIAQLWGVGTVIVWSGVVSLVAFKLVDIVIGLRVAEDEEREGLDVTSHGETAYHH